LLASPDAGAVIDPSPPAPLTGTRAFIEWTPHLAADGSAVAFAGSAAPSALRWERFVLDLTPTPRDNPLVRLTDDDEPTGNGGFGDTHPSLSADGGVLARAVYTGTTVGTVDFYEVRVLDRVTGVDAALAIVPTTSVAAPRPAVSADGAYVWVQEVFEAGVGSYKYRARRLATDQASCTWDCDCTVPFDSWPPVLAATQAATTGNGRFVVGSDGNVPANAVRRVELVGGSCAAQSSATLAQHGTAGGTDVTVSADGLVAAWSTRANYETGGTFNDTNVWVWLDATIDVPSPCPGSQCVPSPAGGTIVRVLTLPTAPQLDSKPLVTADGRRVFFISTGDYGGQNPFGAAALWVVDLEATASWAPQRVSPLEGLPFAHRVEHATANADGTAVAYTLFHDTDADTAADARDLRVVLVDDDAAMDLVEPPGMTAAHQPFEVQGVTCSHAGGGDVLVRYDIRQFRGGTRQLVTTLEARAAGGTSRRLGPFVQQLRDEHVAEVTRTLALADGDLDDITCRALVLWGAGAQPDAVVAAWP
jgi:hypothetical protein